MCDHSTSASTQSIADYLAQLLKDRKQLAAFPNIFMHVERLLDEEIAKVRASLFQINGVKKEPLILPEPEGQVTTLTEKVYVPVKEHPDFNFVGRILGPRGMTAKQLEQETGCKIMVRGKGSMRDKKKEDQNRGKPNWEHLSDELHVLLTVEDTENRAQIKLARAVEEVKKLLVPQADGEDELKKRQLMELAIINGTYRDSSSKAASATDLSSIAACDEEWRRVAAAVESQRLLSPAMSGLATPLRAPAAPLGAPLILSPRMSVPTTAASILNGSAPPGSLLSPGDPHGLIYAPYADYTNYATLTASPLLTEYATADHSGGFFLSDTIKHNLIDHYIPFLPLEEKHIILCIKDEFKARDVFIPFKQHIQEILNYVEWGPDSSRKFSKTGCKGLSQKVALLVARHSDKYFLTKDEL